MLPGTLPAALSTAQAMSDFNPLGQQARRLAIAPRGGAVGSEVTVGMAGAPPKANIRIAFANLQAYELIHSVQADEQGNFTTTVKIPDWALADQVHYFFANPGGGQPRAFSDGYHVTTPDGTLNVQGVLGADVDGCVELRNAEDVVYNLVGDIGEWIPGDEVAVTGTIAAAGGCGEGVRIEVRGMTTIHHG
jgi:hypothetical protein